MNIGRCVAVVAMGTALACATATAQVKPRETFEVASIKENDSGSVESFAYPYNDTGRLRLVNHTANQMIRQAFGVRDWSRREVQVRF
ncbi:MAG: hypothetical protein ACRD3G_09645 [Vicinamibacterales bacterium]